MSKVKKSLVIVLSALLFAGLLCAAKLMKSSAEVSNVLKIEYETPGNSAFLGETVRLPEAKPLYADKVDHIYYEIETPDGNRKKAENLSLLLQSEGEYTVYICVAGVDGSSYAESYKINVKKSDKPVLTQRPVLPAAFIGGVQYKVPAARFTDYNSDTPSVINAEVYYEDENGNERAISGEFMPNAAIHGAKTALKFVVGSSVTGGKTEVRYEIPVVQAAGVRESDGEYTYAFDKMFVTEGAVYSELNENGATFYGSGEFGMTYANLLRDDVEIRVKSARLYDNFESMRFIVADAADEYRKICAEVWKKDGEYSYVSVNGGDKILTEGSVSDYSKGFGISLSGSSGKILNINGKPITTAKTYEDGTAFCGFPSGYVKVTAEVNSPASDSAISLYYLNGQNMNSARTTDSISPYIELKNEIELQRAKNEKITIAAANVFDVLDPNAKVMVNVIAPSGEVAVSDDGVSLWEASAEREYEFEAESLGEYTVQYVAEDRSKNVFDSFYFTIFVSDVTPPVITVNTPVKARVSVGESVKIPEAEYSDDLTAKEDLVLFITVSLSKGSYKVVKPGDTFVFENAGKYYIRYTVIDAYCNMTTYEQVVACE